MISRPLLALLCAALGASANDLVAVPHAVAISAASLPEWLAVGDLNGDGVDDPVVTSDAGGTEVLLSPDWTLTSLSTSQTAVGAWVADVDGDGGQDVLVGDSNELRVWLDPTGDPSAYTGVATAGTPRSFAVTDDRVVLVGLGSGVVQSVRFLSDVRTIYEGADAVFDLATPDLNGDGHEDLIAVLETSMVVMAGNGTGLYELLAVYDVGSIATSVGVADLDDDGDLDALVVAYGNGVVMHFSNDGSGALTREADAMTVNYAPYDLATGDFNLDSQPDFVLAEQHKRVGFVPGAPPFGARQDLFYNSVLDVCVSVATSDVDGDGDLDAWVISKAESTLYWIEMQSVPFAPTNVSASVYASNGSVLVTWSPPASDNGAAVTSYVVNDGAWNATAPSLVVPPADIEPGVSYSFVVRAVNSRGTGLASAAVEYNSCFNGLQDANETCVDGGGEDCGPCPPVNVTCAAADYSLLVEMQTNGAAQYVVSAGTDNVTVVSAAASETLALTLTGLANYEPHDVTIVAVDEAGVAGPSAVACVNATARPPVTLVRNEAVNLFPDGEPADLLQDSIWATIDLADVSGAGNLDFVVGCYPSPYGLGVYENAGTLAEPAFPNTASQSVLGHSFQWKPACADFDLDGDVDCVGGSTIAQRVDYAPNDGNGNLAYVDESASPFDGLAVECGMADHIGTSVCDFDGDGFVDLLVSDKTPTSCLWRNNGSGGYSVEAAPMALAAELERSGEQPSTVEVCDVDFDGDEDALVTTKHSGSVLLTNVGSPTNAVWADPVPIDSLGDARVWLGCGVGFGTTPDRTGVLVAFEETYRETWNNGSVFALYVMAAHPEAPSVVEAIASYDTITVSWDVPSVDGGIAITNFTVTENVTLTSVTTEATTAVFSGLDLQQRYSFTVSAANALGSSAPSGASAAAQLLLEPSAVLNLTCVADDYSVAVSWAEPEHHASTYAVTAAGKTTADIIDTSLTVTGLKNWVAYNVSVAAVNAYGTGVAVECEATPAVPTTLAFGESSQHAWFTAEVDAWPAGAAQSIVDFDGDGALDLCFGGYATSPRCMLNSGSSAAPQLLPPDDALFANVDVSGGSAEWVWPTWVDLDNDTDVDLVVSLYGYGHSLVSYYENPGDGGLLVAAALPIFSGVDDCFYKTFGDIDDDGDLDLFCTADTRRVWLENVGNASHPVFDEANNDFYPLPVASDSRLRSAALCDADGDGDLDLFTGNAGDVFENTASGFVTAPETWIKYPADVAIACVQNWAGEPVSLVLLASDDLLWFVPDAGHPDEPAAAPTATNGYGYADVSWLASARDNGYAVTEYTVFENVTGAAQTTAGDTELRFTGLDAGTAYSFTVTAASLAGVSGRTDASGAISPFAVPDVVTNLTCTAGDLSVSIVWDAPEFNAATHYVVNNWTTAYPAMLVDELTNGESYNFSISAVNANGTGPSTECQATPRVPFLGLVFDDSVSYPFSGEGYPAFGDVDGDGDADLVVSTATLLRYFPWDGGAFVAVDDELDSTFPNVNVSLARPAIADVDGDGAAELLLGEADGSVSLWTSNADAEFVTFETLGGVQADNGGSAHPAAADWDGDGDVDLLVGSSTSGHVALFLNDGAGVFSSSSSSSSLSSGTNWSAPAVCADDVFVADGGGLVYVNGEPWNVSSRAEAWFYHCGACVDVYVHVVIPTADEAKHASWTFAGLSVSYAGATTSGVDDAHTVCLDPGVAYEFVASEDSTFGNSGWKDSYYEVIEVATGAIALAPTEYPKNTATSQTSTVVVGVARDCSASLPHLGQAQEQAPGPQAVACGPKGTLVVDWRTARLAGRPFAPSTAATVVAGHGYADVSWAAGTDNGAAITQYTVVTNTSLRSTTSERQLRFSGLEANASYTFAVFASNVVGDSPLSEQRSAAVRALPTPDAVDHFVCWPGDYAVSAAWTAPVDVAGSAVTQFTVLVDGAEWQQSMASNVSVTGLDANYQAHNMTVWATNAEGDGPALSCEVVPRPPPLLINGSGSLYKVFVDEASPVLDASAAIAFGDVNGDGNTDMVSTGRSVALSVVYGTDEGLLDGSTYVVLKTNAVDCNYPTVSVADLDRDGDDDVLVWNDVADWIYFRQDDQGDLAEDENPLTAVDPNWISFGDMDADGDVDGLTDSATLWLQDDDGDWSKATMATAAHIEWRPTLCDVDGDGDLDVISSTVHGDISFSENVGDAFVLEWSSVAWDASPVTSIDAVYPTAGCWPDVGVALVGAATGWTWWGDFAGHPEAPPSVSAASGGTGFADVTWSVPEVSGGASVTQYTVYVNATDTAPQATSDASLRFTGLLPNAGYQFSVAAGNVVGFSPTSTATAVATPSGHPSAVLDLECTPGDYSALVQWAHPEFNAADEYEVAIASEGRTAVTASTNATLGDLQNWVTYNVTVTPRSLAFGVGPAAACAVTPEVPLLFLVEGDATSWAPESGFSFSDAGVSISLVDVNADGARDLIVGGAGDPASTVRVAFNTGSDAAPVFQTPEAGPLPAFDSDEFYTWAYAPDLDGDGDQDLVLVHVGSVEVYFYANDSFVAGDGSFGDAGNVLAFGDVDADGDLDAFTTTNLRSWWLENVGGNDTFAETGSIPLGEIDDFETTNSAALCDFDKDGDLDLFTSNADFDGAFENVGTPSAPDFRAVTAWGRLPDDYFGVCVRDWGGHDLSFIAAPYLVSSGDDLRWFVPAGHPDDVAPLPQVQLLGASSVNVSWTAPGDNGATVTQYSVSVSGNVTTTNAPFLVLTGESFNVSVKAHNVAGESRWTEPVPVTLNVAEPPRIFCQGRDYSVFVWWLPPATTFDVIEYVLGDGSRTTATSVTISDLENDEPFTVSLAAVTVYGLGDAASCEATPTAPLVFLPADMSALWGGIAPVMSKREADAAPCLSDVDGDGDLDLVLGLRDSGVRYLRNGSSSAYEFEELYSDESPLPLITRLRPVPRFVDYELDGTANDLLVAAADGLVTLNDTVVLFSGTGELCADAADLDGDGVVDLVVGHGNGSVTWPWDQEVEVGAHACPSIVDVDGDGDLDVLVGSDSDLMLVERLDTGAWLVNASWWPGLGGVPFGISNTSNVLIGEAGGTGLTMLDTASGATSNRDSYLDSMFAISTASTSALVLPRVSFGDRDGDGDTDLVLGMHIYSPQMYFDNVGTDAAPVLRLERSGELPLSLGGGYFSWAHLADVDGNGVEDVVLSGGLSIAWWRDQNQEILVDGPFGEINALPNEYADDDLLAFADFDGDGDDDMLYFLEFGLEDGMRLYENVNGSFPTATFTNPFEGLIDLGMGNMATADACDLDGDGDVDVVLYSREQGGVFVFENVGNAQYARFAASAWEVRDSFDSSDSNRQVACSGSGSGVFVGGSASGAQWLTRAAHPSDPTSVVVVMANSTHVQLSWSSSPSSSSSSSSSSFRITEWSTGQTFTESTVVAIPYSPLLSFSVSLSNDAGPTRNVSAALGTVELAVTPLAHGAEASWTADTFVVEAFDYVNVTINGELRARLPVNATSLTALDLSSCVEHSFVVAYGSALEGAGSVASPPVTIVPLDVCPRLCGQPYVDPTGVDPFPVSCVGNWTALDDDLAWGRWQALAQWATSSRLADGSLSLNTPLLEGVTNCTANSSVPVTVAVAATTGEVQVDGAVLAGWEIRLDRVDTHVVAQPAAEVNYVVSLQGGNVTVVTEPAAADVEFSLDGGATWLGSRGAEFNDTSEALHTIAVRAAVDWFGADETPAEVSWTYDVSPPVAVFSVAPLQYSPDPMTVFVLDSSERPATLAYCVAGDELCGEADLLINGTSYPDTELDSLVITSSSVAVSVAGDGEVQMAVDYGSWEATDAVALTGSEWHALHVRTSVRGVEDPYPVGIAVLAQASADTVPPDTYLVAAPPAEDWSGVQAFDASASEADCAFQHSVDDGATWLAGGAPVFTNLTIGLYALLVRAVDPAGNVDPTPVLHEWQVVDPPVPDTVLLAAPAAFLSPALASSAEVTPACDLGDCTFEYSMDRGASWASDPPAVSTYTAVGAYHLSVRATTAQGRVDATPAVAAWQVVPEPEATLAARPPAFTTFAVAVFAVDVSGASSCSSTYAVTSPQAPEYSQVGEADSDGVIVLEPVDLGSYALSVDVQCEGALAAALEYEWSVGGESTSGEALPTLALADGDYSAWVRATDPAGNVGPTATWNWTVDTLPPESQLHWPHADVESESTLAFNVTCNEACSLELLLDGREEAELRNLTDGLHAVQVTAVDLAGNRGATHNRSVIVDSRPPELSVVSVHGAYAAAAEFVVSCADVSGCTTTTTTDGSAFDWEEVLVIDVEGAEGALTVSVTAEDAVGNTAEAAAVITVDLTPPETLVLEQPPLFYNSGLDIPLRFGCNDSISPCAVNTSVPLPLTNLTDGVYNVSGWAVDDAGNVGAVIAVAFEVDTVPPDNVTLAVEYVSTSSAVVSSPLVSLVLAPGSGDLEFSSSSGLLSGPDGDRTVCFIPFDAAGNEGATACLESVVFDTVRPVVTITPVPATLTAESSTLVEFEVSDASDVFCDVPEPVVVEASDALVRYEVVCTDERGNVGSDAVEWFVDVTDPVLRFTTPVEPLVNVANLSFAFASTDNTSVATVCSLVDVDDWAEAECWSPWLVGGLEDRTYVLEVVATDAVGHAAVANATFTVDTTAPTLELGDVPTTTSETTVSLTVRCVTVDEVCGKEELADDEDCVFSSVFDGGAVTAHPAGTELLSFDGGEAEQHNVTVTATDSAGNAAQRTVSWTYDPGALPSFVSVPPEASGVTWARFELDATVPNAEFEYKLDADDYLPVNGTSLHLTGLEDGATHTLLARIVGYDTPVTHVWSCTHCEAGELALETTLPGTGELQCIGCPDGEPCSETGDNLRAHTEMLDDFWLPRAASEMREGDTIYDCVSAGSCVDGGCREGHEGVLCAVCSEGWAKTLEGNCESCEGQDDPGATGALIVVGGIALSVAAAFIVKQSLKTDATARSVSTLKIMANYFLMMAILKDLELDWGSMVNTLFSYMGVASGGGMKDVQLVNCALPVDTYSQYAVLFSVMPMVFVVPGCVIALAAAAVRAQVWSRGEKQPKNVVIWEVKPSFLFRQSVMVLAYFAYPVVVTAALRVLHCQEVEGASYLVEDFAKTCSGSQYAPFRAMAVVVLAIVTPGVPLGIFFSMRRFRDGLYDGSNDKAKTQFFFFFGEFRPEWYWWEVTVMARKVGMAAVSVLLSNSDEGWQVYAGTWLLLASFVAQVTCLPHGQPLQRNLETAAQATVLSSLLFGQAVALATTDARRDAFRVAVLVVNLAVMSGLFVVLAREVLRDARSKLRRRPQEAPQVQMTTIPHRSFTANPMLAL